MPPKTATPKPALGLIPKAIYYHQVLLNRYTDVCDAMVRYYQAGLPIKPEWIDEYEQLHNAMLENGLNPTKDLSSIINKTNP